ncbi:hypothetical protein COHA_001504 [Chlorella ohadii]|uniref:Uncharacterized protein n=1 Tax=Chlorella ohadii TaxID=2649997 RepID=A0AAD5H5R6_9CHLO|nr:hypothetical protein COHA_001504 [Chlorella ohadii]
MLRALAAQQAAPQLLAAVRAGACGALASGVLRRGLAAMVEPTAFPPADRDSFHYAVLQAPLMKEETGGSLPRFLLPYVARLGGMGGLRAPDRGEQAYQAALTAAREAQPFALLVGSGGTEQSILDLAHKYHREYCKAKHALAGELPREIYAEQACGEGATVPPLLLVAHPYANSLPSALEALARLQQARSADGYRGRIVYLPSAAQGAADDAWASLQESLKASRPLRSGVRVWHQLHRSRIGLVGQPSSWLVASTPSAGVVGSSWGPSLVDIDMQELLGGLWGTGSFKKGEVEAVVQDMLAGKFLLVDRHGLSCISVRCFDVVTAKETTGCYSLSRLLDEKVVAGCEGDVCSALGMLWGQAMTGQTPWMANIAQASQQLAIMPFVDPPNGVVKLAHCTIARSLLASHEATTHFESGLGVALKGKVPPGAVTLLRIGGKQLDQLWLEEGYVLEEAAAEGAWSPNLCRTQVRVSLLGGRPVVDGLLQRPLGNHVVMLRGHHKSLLSSYFSQFGPGFEKA